MVRKVVAMNVGHEDVFNFGMHMTVPGSTSGAITFFKNLSASGTAGRAGAGGPLSSVSMCSDTLPVAGPERPVDYVRIEGTVWPVAGDIEWRLRYGTSSREDLLAAASVVAAYRGLCRPEVTVCAAVGKLRRAHAVVAGAEGDRR